MCGGQGIVPILAQLLGWTTQEQAIQLCLLFLARLSIREETVTQLRDSFDVSTVVAHVTSMHPRVRQLAQQLIYNLSFDSALSKKMVDRGCITHVRHILVAFGDTCCFAKVCRHLGKESDHALLLRILYQLSIDDGNKSTFAYTGRLPVLMEMLLEETEHASSKSIRPEVLSISDESTLISLFVNLTLSERNCEV